MSDERLDIDDAYDTIVESMSADDRKTKKQYQAACSSLSAVCAELRVARTRISELEQSSLADKAIADRVRHVRSLQLLPGFPDAEKVVASEIESRPPTEAYQLGYARVHEAEADHQPVGGRG